MAYLRRMLFAVCAWGLLVPAPRLVAQEHAPAWPALHGGHPAPEYAEGGWAQRRGGEGGAEEPIETDRDSFTPATTVVGRGRLLVESSYSFIDNRDTFETHSFPELLLRAGVLDCVELRLGWNYEVGGEGSDVSGAAGDEELGGAGLSREHRVLYGVKLAVTEQDELLPASAMIVQGYTPTGGEATDTQVTATYVFGWEEEELGVKFDAGVRYGTASAGEDRFGIWAPSAVVRVPVGERVNVHAEYFALFSHDRGQDFSRHFISPGVHYLVTDDLEVGVRLGWGLNDQSPRFFTNAGLGWRF